MRFYIPLLSQKQLENTKIYKSNGEDNSITRKYVTNHFYNWLMNYVPMNMAPNMITLTGWFFMLVPSALALIYSPTLDSLKVPNFVFLICGLCTFIYQTLDNLDGKQARRTGTSSCLGELFDHGCDALTTGIGMYSMFLSFSPGVTKSGAFFHCLTYLSFLFSTWEEYFVGGLKLGLINGPNEGLLVSIAALLLGGIFGQGIYHTEIIPGTGFKVVHIILILTSISTVAGIIGAIISVSQRTGASGIYSAASGLIPTLITLAFYMMCFDSETFQSHPHLFIWTVTFSASFFISGITLAHLTSSPLEYFHFTNIPMLFFIFAQISGIQYDNENGLVSWALFLFYFLNYANFAVAITCQLAGFLGINVLTIKKKNE